MSKNINEIFETLSVERRQNIEKRAEILKAEYLDFQDVRQATQNEIAAILNINQDGEFLIEEKVNLLTAILQSYVKSMGGELKFVVEFPDRPSVSLKGIGEVLNHKP